MTEILSQWTVLTEEYLKANAPISININLKQIKPYISIAEKIWLEPVIGLPLYEELLEQVNTNKLTEENSTLYLMLAPYISFAVIYESAPFLMYHFSDVGVTRGKSDNSDSITINEANFISTRLRSTLETLKSNFKKWLDDHSDSYPLYKPDTCSGDNSECTDCDWIIQYYGGGYKHHNWQYFFKLFHNAWCNHQAPFSLNILYFRYFLNITYRRVFAKKICLNYF